MLGRTTLLATLLLLFADMASAGVGQWTTQGPPGGFVQDLAVDPLNPSTAYAVTHGNGVFRTRDGGQNWTSINSGLRIPRNAWELVVDPVDSDRLYLAIVFAGVFRSIDGGDSWTAANEGLGSLIAFQFALDPAQPSTVYVGTQDAGVFRSRDGASTWQAVNDGLDNLIVQDLAIDSTTEPSTV